MLIAGGTCILVPRVSVESYAKLLKKEKPNYIAGVPTLYEGITRNPYMDGRGSLVAQGRVLGRRFALDRAQKEIRPVPQAARRDRAGARRIRHDGVRDRELPDAVRHVPRGQHRAAVSDTYYKIVKVGTTDEVPYGEEGEICLTGPSMMMGYVNQPEETAHTMQVHADGRTWVHTGDLGLMDEDGFVYFRQRIKRMSVTSGYNVYPSQLENILDAHEAVQMSCVIGVRDSYKMQKVKAFIVLRPGLQETPELMESIWEHCRRHIAKYAMPYEIEVRDSLPKTLVGKVAYTVLEKEELARQSA